MRLSFSVTETHICWGKNKEINCIEDKKKLNAREIEEKKKTPIPPPSRAHRIGEPLVFDIVKKQIYRREFYKKKKTLFFCNIL